MLPLPKSDAQPFQNITSALADLTAAAITHERGVTGGTHNGKTWAWSRWTKYCKSVRCTDFFMDQLTRNERIIMLWAFAMAIREGQFLPDCHEVLIEGTVCGTVSHVILAFWAARRQNPTKDDDIELSILLSWQYQAYKNKDPQQVQQKALPFIVLDKLATRQVTELNIALAQLTIGAAFFACCSSKYSTVSRREEKHTKLLCLQNIRFFRDVHLISASSADFVSADSVAIRFQMQKNDMKYDTVIHS